MNEIKLIKLQIINENEKLKHCAIYRMQRSLGQQFSYGSIVITNLITEIKVHCKSSKIYNYLLT